MSQFQCCLCGNNACSKVRKKDDEDDEIDLYYCKDCLRGYKNDENFFGVH